jgi:mono/diheme cytochrome c family protein
MKKVFKWIGIVLGSLVGLILVLAAVFYFMGNARLNKTYDFPPSNIVVPTDAASIEYGKHRVETLCIGCHGEDLSGISPFVSVEPMFTLDSANLTSGEGGIGGEFAEEDYVRAIRHGIDREGKPIFMPAVVALQHLSDEDLGAIIAYLKTIPAVNHTTGGFQMQPLGKIFAGAGMIGNLPVEDASHITNVTAPDAGVSVEYGEYLVAIGDCSACHGQELAGGVYPDPSVTLITPNLTPGGELGFWTEEQFINTLRTGTTPSGYELDPSLMPWMDISKFYDDELKAVWLYLQSLPKLEQYTE